MGLHHTKTDQSSSSSSSIHHEHLSCCPSSLITTRIKTKTKHYSGWEEIYRCSHHEWLEEISGKIPRNKCLSPAVIQIDLEKFGFSPHAFMCNSELHSICAPGFCSESLSRKLSGFSRSSKKTSRSIKSKKLREHFEYNHIPAMISSLQNYSVHGIVNGSSLVDRTNADTIMLSIYSISLDKTKFIIVDLKLNRYICALENDYYGLIDVSKVHSAWSMDRTQVILRIPMPNNSAALDFFKGKYFL